MGVLSSTLSVLLAVVFFSSPPASADSLIYDPYLDIYWMKDGNNKGLMTWDDAKKWAEQLTYGGYDDWRLPSTPDGYYIRNDGTIWDYYNSGTNPNDNKYNVTFSDLGSLYYNFFKLKADENLSTVKNSPFNNLQAGYYWFETASSQLFTNQSTAWIFDFKFGTQFLNTTTSLAYAIAVRDASPAPEPSTALLFLTGLLGLCRIRRQRNR